MDMLEQARRFLEMSDREVFEKATRTLLAQQSIAASLIALTEKLDAITSTRGEINATITDLYPK